MDIKHRSHKHPDGIDYKCQRVYVRTNKLFQPVGWRCLACGAMMPD